MAVYGASGGNIPDDITIDLNSSQNLEVKPSTITQTSSTSNITYSTNTTLSGDVYANNLTINSGITLTTNGYNIYCSGTFTNNGNIITGNSSSGGLGAIESTATNATAGTSYTSSYGGSGGGGGGGNGTLAGNASGGGFTLVSGGTAASGNSSGGGGGSTSAPTITNTLLATWLSNGFNVYLNGSGGGGGYGTSLGSGLATNGGSGGGGGYGLMIYATSITAGNINSGGAIGNVSPTTNYGGSGGGGGGGSILLIYKNIYTTGTYTTTGGSGGANNAYGQSGGGGGSGIVITYQYTIPPLPLSTFTYSAGAVLSNFNEQSNFGLNNTTSTTAVNIGSITFTPQTSDYVSIQAIVRVNNSVLGDGVAVSLLNGTTVLDTVTFTQEGLANNPYQVVLYFVGSYSGAQTFNLTYNAITGGTATIIVQSFLVSEVY